MIIEYKVDALINYMGYQKPEIKLEPKIINYQTESIIYPCLLTQIII